MDRFLRAARRLSRLLAVVALASALAALQVSAGTQTGKFTGYAMGNKIGASGREIIQSYCANHAPGTKCGGVVDPSGLWPWGTRIDTPQSVLLHDQAGNAYYRSSFYLYDNGDPYCQMGMYWVDIYHGRYKWPSQTCTCTGYLNPNHVCYDGQTNSCTDAQNFGVKTWTYTYTFP